MSNEDLLGTLRRSLADQPKTVTAAVVPAANDSDDLASRFKKERKPQKKQVSFYMSAQLEDRLMDLKRKTDLSMTVLIERLLEEVMGLK